jgi:DNA-binding NarL/FixJ family response regulator
MGKSATVVELAVGDAELAQRVRAALMEHPGFEVVSADDGRRPEVLVTDATDDLLGDLSGDLADAVPVVVIAHAWETAEEALRAGAVAVLAPDADAEALRAAVRAAASGLTTLSPVHRRRLLDGPGDGHVDGQGRHDLDEDDAPLLTARELQVLRLLVEGASNKTIARRLGITPHTAKFHVAAIAAKLGAAGRTDAVAKALRLGLVMA